MKSTEQKIGEVVGTLLGAATLVILIPLMYAVGGYFTGWVLGSVFKFAGTWVVQGMQVFGFEVALFQLPWVGALLGFTGAFFRSNQSKS